MSVRPSAIETDKQTSNYQARERCERFNDGFDVTSFEQIGRLKQLVFRQSVCTHSLLHRRQVLHQREITTLRVDFLHEPWYQLVHQPATVHNSRIKRKGNVFREGSVAIHQNMNATYNSASKTARRYPPASLQAHKRSDWPVFLPACTCVCVRNNLIFSYRFRRKSACRQILLLARSMQWRSEGGGGAGRVGGAG